MSDPKVSVHQPGVISAYCPKCERVYHDGEAILVNTDLFTWHCPVSDCVDKKGNPTELQVIIAGDESELH